MRSAATEGRLMSDLEFRRMVLGGPGFIWTYSRLMGVSTRYSDYEQFRVEIIGFRCSRRGAIEAYH